MSRDFSVEDNPVSLTESPNPTDESGHLEEGRFLLLREHDNEAPIDDANSLQTLHPYTRLLTISDLESCVTLETAAFAEHERCSREKFIYRLTACGELSLGIFCTATAESGIPAETLRTGRPVETEREDQAVGVLLAHIVATRSRDEVITDDAMDLPSDWNNPKRSSESSVGHKEDGRTICLHSLCVLPEYQGRGLGQILLLAYLQQMNGAGIADRIALIAHDHLVPYYEKMGFENKGRSKAQFGGGGWIDMIFELKPIEARAMYG